jgi:hypothetical protein
MDNSEHILPPITLKYRYGHYGYVKVKKGECTKNKEEKEIEVYLKQRKCIRK